MERLKRIVMTSNVNLCRQALFEKLVVRGKRGGWCHELNGLFGCLLAEVGFPGVLMLSSSAWIHGAWRRDFNHMALVVTLADGRKYLAEVGWGMYKVVTRRVRNFIPVAY